MKPLSPIIQSGIVGIVAGYAGQALGKVVIKRQLPSLERSDFVITTLAAIAMIASPVPVNFMQKTECALGLSTLMGMAWEYYKSGQSGGKEEETPPAPVSVTPVPIAPVPIAPVQSLAASLPLPPLQEQLHGLTAVDKKNYDKFKKDMGITDVTMCFNHTNLAKFATVYYKIYDSATTTIQEILKKHTKPYIKDALKIIHQTDINGYDNQKNALDGLQKSYEQLLQNKEAVLSKRKKFISDSLTNIFKDYLLRCELNKTRTSTSK